MCHLNGKRREKAKGEKVENAFGNTHAHVRKQTGLITGKREKGEKILLPMDST
jgi:hypothetical protein